MLMNGTSLTVEPTFLTSSEQYGWFSDSDFSANGGKGYQWKQLSGLKKSAYNIYDMGGNVHEWIFTALEYEWCRSVVGTSFSESSSGRSAIFFTGDGPAVSTDPNVGCRAQLYIK